MATANSDFELVGPSHTFRRPTVTLWCRLSSEISAVNMEIRWFKETDCVCVYKNRQVTEGRRYEDRVSLFTQELERGNVSLQLRDCTVSDEGHYLCQVTDGDRTEEITVEMISGVASSHGLLLRPSALRDRKWTEDERMKMKESALQNVSSVDRDFTSLKIQKEIKMATSSNDFKLVGPSHKLWCPTVTLSCHLSPEISAVNMEIRWFKGTECVCVYKNRQVKEGSRYEGRVSLFTQLLERGIISLKLRDCTESDEGHYRCQVTDGDRTERFTVEMVGGASSYRLLPARLSGSGSSALRDRKWTEVKRMKMKESALQNVSSVDRDDDEGSSALRDRKWTEVKRMKMEESALQNVSSVDRDDDEGSSALSDRKWTEDERMKMEKSVLLTVSSVDQPSSAVEELIPELVEKYVEDETKDEYRLQVPHAGQFKCKVTKLMFEMEGDGEVLYSIVSWDRCPLDGLGQNEPAGPLYSINCHRGSIRKLHLPHCETRKDDVKLTVAHVTGGNVEIIQPLRVTDTHVIIDVHNLSRFGLLIDLIYTGYPIKAQVLVFDMNLKGKHRKNKLHMHLLPGNVPAVEVKKQECNMSKNTCQPYIASRATCDLTPGKEYWPVSKNTDHKITIQPEFKKFERDYDPNYHPTFVVLFSTEVDEVTLGLLDENKKEMWSRLVLLTGTEAAPTTINTTGINFVDTYRAELIQRVSSGKEIADCLKDRAMITKELCSNIQAAPTPQEKMRELYNCLNSGAVKAEFYRILQEKEPYLVQELQSGMSNLRNT